VEASNAAKPDNARPKPKPRPGKRARAANEVKMPDELKGGHSKTVDNKPICNTSLRIKDECLIFTTTKICSNVNKLTRQKKRKPKPSLNLNSETYFELHMSL
jgi:hypothetical protein